MSPNILILKPYASNLNILKDPNLEIILKDVKESFVFRSLQIIANLLSRIQDGLLNKNQANSTTNKIYSMKSWSK
jgi:hypothetical protein